MYSKRLLSLLLGVALFSSPVLKAENLEYVAYYKGVFSLFEKISIADVVLNTETFAEPSSVSHKATLSVSSEAHKTVERLYPFRYSFDSYFDAQRSRTLAFEHLKSSKKKGKKHFLGFIDAERGQAQLFNAQAHEPLLSAALLQDFVEHGLSSQRVQALSLEPKSSLLENVGEGAADRLTLLSLMREQLRQGEARRDYLVTNANKLMKYRVSVSGTEALTLADQHKLQARKLKIEAWEHGEPELIEHNHDDSLQFSSEPEPNYMHAPVYAWFSADASVVPLKFVNKHAVGEFVIEVKDYKSLNKVALSD